MLNLKFIMVSILFMSTVSMAKNNQEFYTSTYPNYWGNPLIEKFWANNGKEFYLKNSTVDRIGSKNNKINGVGLIVKSLTEKEAEDYDKYGKKIFLLNKKYDVKSSKDKKLNFRFFEISGENTVSSILFNSKDSNGQEVLKWFNEKKINFINSSESKMEIGFKIITKIKKSESDYVLELIFENLSGQDILITGVNDWEVSNENRRSKIISNLVIRDGLNASFKFSLNKYNLIEKNEDLLNNLILPGKMKKSIHFKLDKNEMDKLEEYQKIIDDAELKYYVVMDLRVLSPSIIAGDFHYLTSLNEFIYSK